MLPSVLKSLNVTLPVNSSHRCLTWVNNLAATEPAGVNDPLHILHRSCDAANPASSECLLYEGSPAGLRGGNWTAAIRLREYRIFFRSASGLSCRKAKADRLPACSRGLWESQLSADAFTASASTPEPTHFSPCTHKPSATMFVCLHFPVPRIMLSVHRCPLVACAVYDIWAASYF